MSDDLIHCVRVYRWTGDIPGATSLTETVHRFRVRCSVKQAGELCAHFWNRGLFLEYSTHEVRS